MKISNRLIVCGLIWGLVLKIWGNGYVGILYFILNITIPVVLLFLLFQMHALGAGDIKLFSLVGGFLTTKQLFLVMFDSFSFCSSAWHGKSSAALFSQREEKGKIHKIHFSIEILLAVVYVTGECVVAKLKLPFVIRTNFIVSALRLI